MSEKPKKQESTHGPKFTELFSRPEVKKVLSINLELLISSGIYKEYLKQLAIRDDELRVFRFRNRQHEASPGEQVNFDDIEPSTEHQDTANNESPILVQQVRDDLGETTFCLGKLTRNGYEVISSDVELFKDDLHSGKTELIDGVTLSGDQVETIRQIYREQEAVGIVIFDEQPILDISPLFDIGETEK